MLNKLYAAGVVIVLLSQLLLVACPGQTQCVAAYAVIPLEDALPQATLIVIGTVGRVTRRPDQGDLWATPEYEASVLVEETVRGQAIASAPITVRMTCEPHLQQGEHVLLLLAEQAPAVTRLVVGPQGVYRLSLRDQVMHASNGVPLDGDTSLAHLLELIAALPRAPSAQSSLAPDQGVADQSGVRAHPVAPEAVTVAYVRDSVLYIQTAGADAIPVEDCTATNCHPVYLKWSPDGRRLLYYWEPADYFAVYGESPGQIRLADPNGQVQIVAEHIPHLRPPTWSPDGRHLAYLVTTDRFLDFPSSAIRLMEVWTADVSSDGRVQNPRLRGEIGIDEGCGGGGWSESAESYEREGGSGGVSRFAALLEWTADDILIFSNTCFAGGGGRFHLGLGLELAPYPGGLHSLSLNAAKNAWVAIDEEQRMVLGVPTSLAYELIATQAQPELVFFGQITGDLYYTTLVETGRTELEDAVARIQPAVNVKPYFEFTRPGLRVIQLPARTEALLWEGDGYAYARVAQGVDGALFFARVEDNVELYEAISQGKLTADNLYELLPQVDVLWLPPGQIMPTIWLENAAQFALAPPINRTN